MLWAGFQLARRVENGDAGTFAANQREGDVEAVLRQQLVQVVTEHTTRNIEEARADEIGVCVTQPSQAGVDLSATSACSNYGDQLLFAGATHAHAGSVVEKDVERFD